MAAPKPVPDLNIPRSEHTVTVSIIDTTTRVNGLPTAAFTLPEVGEYSVIMGGCSYSFLIEHGNSDAKSKYDRLLFDLGFRTDPENGPQAIMQQMTAAGVEMRAKQGVYDVLKEKDGRPDEIGGIIWSHYHPVSTD